MVQKAETDLMLAGMPLTQMIEHCWPIDTGLRHAQNSMDTAASDSQGTMFRYALVSVPHICLNKMLKAVW